MSKANINSCVGKRLRLRRTIMGLSQEAVGNALDITFQQIQKYEKGSNAMSTDRLYELAQVMHVPVSYFFEDIENQRAPSQDNRVASDRSKISDRETLELMKAFKQIKSPVIRKRLSDLVRAVINVE